MTTYLHQLRWESQSKAWQSREQYLVIFRHFEICLFENVRLILHLAVAHPAHLDPASRLEVIVTEQNLENCLA